MVMAALILILSTALWCFYCQVAIQKILRRAFDHACLQTLVRANRLMFPTLHASSTPTSASGDYAGLRTSIECDFRTLTYLLKHSCNLRQCHSRQERMLMLYFRLVLGCLSVRHWLRLREKPTVELLAAILQYFANLVGERVSSCRLVAVPVSSHLPSL